MRRLAPGPNRQPRSQGNSRGKLPARANGIGGHSFSNPWSVNFSVRLFSVTMRTTLSGAPAGIWASIDDTARYDARRAARELSLPRGEDLILRDAQGRPHYVAVEWTSCGFGGVRAWVRCSGCDRRVGVLYQRRSFWRCRVCHDLIYATTRLPRVARLVRRAVKVRARLGLPADVLTPLTQLDKPPRMWRRRSAPVLVQVEEVEGQMRATVVASLRACTASLADRGWVGKPTNSGARFSVSTQVSSHSVQTYRRGRARTYNRSADEFSSAPRS